ncbi:MAG: hypothetical protein IJW31_01470 [Lentisphaeria bacterium]|nr:hypothetical protein [Lentisphaeria bacterium]
MKKFISYFLLIAASLFLSSCCSSTLSEETIQTLDNFKENSPYIWGGREFKCRLYRKGNHYYLESQIVETRFDLGHKFTKYLGENIVPSEQGMFLGNDGRMYIKYINNKGEKCESSVPFGDIYGDKHISDIPKKEISFNLGYGHIYAWSEIYEVGKPIVEARLLELQKHVRNDDAEAISKMLIYPIWINDLWVENYQDFLKYYPYFFTDLLKNNLLKLQGTDIYCNVLGFMINRGMWFRLGDDRKAYLHVLYMWDY